jgi:hypothetical protein
MAEIIIVRSLTDSDLGIFAAHRASARSKQRAININAPCAARLLSTAVYEQGGTMLDCIVTLGDLQERSARSFSKVHKNWRLGGNKIEGLAFAQVDSADLMLLRSVAPNDGAATVSVTFVARATEPALHARIVGIVAYQLKSSMRVFGEDDSDFKQLAIACSAPPRLTQPSVPRRTTLRSQPQPPVPPMPQASARKPGRSRSIHEKVRSATLIEQMLKVSSDLSAPAQLAFMDTVEQLASQLRIVLVRTNQIARVEKDHANLWQRVAGQQIGFVDGGMANLAMVGAAPVAVRVGGYIVTPGDKTPAREHFIVLKKLISELYAAQDGGVYDGTFPDYGALRDAARISIEAAGAVRVLQEFPKLRWLFLHGALVNPVSRYTDVMQNGKTQYAFPNFSRAALSELLPGEAEREGSQANFINVYLRELELLAASDAVVCGVVERESHTTSVTQAVLNRLDNREIHSVLPLPPAQWKAWFRAAIDPSNAGEGEGPRVTDPLLFRCVLEPGEALVPVAINRNDIRRAPEAWTDEIAQYPQPLVSYLQTTEWSAPVRIEIFSKDSPRFKDIADLVLHCALLLPRYAFPVGLDIVDKFAHIPDWMSRPINTNTAVQALKRALDQGDTKLFDALRRLLCGSEREWLLRPRIL